MLEYDFILYTRIWPLALAKVIWHKQHTSIEVRELCTFFQQSTEMTVVWIHGSVNLLALLESYQTQLQVFQCIPTWSQVHLNDHQTLQSPEFDSGPDLKSVAEAYQHIFTKETSMFTYSSYLILANEGA